MEEEDPAIGDQHPAIGDQHPVIGNQYPAIGDQHPAIGDQPPAIGDQHPTIGDQHPAIGDQHPANGDQHSLEDQITAFGNNEVSASPPTDGLDVMPETVHKMELEVHISLNEFTKGLKMTVDDGKGSEYDCQKPDQYLKDLDIQQTRQLMDLCVMNMKESWSIAKGKTESQTEDDSQARMSGPIVCLENQSAFENITSDEQGDLLPPLVVKPSPPPVNIVITQSSNHDVTVNVGHNEGLMGQQTKEIQNNLDEANVKSGDVVNTTTQEESDRSTMCDTPAGGSLGQAIELPKEDTSDTSACREKLLISTSKETGGELEGDGVSQNTRILPRQFGSKLKHNIVNFHKKTFGILPLTHILLPKRGKCSQGTDVPTITDQLGSRENMEEIVLKEDNTSHVLETMESVAKGPQIRNERSKYEEVRNTCSSTFDFLKHNVIKGAITQGSKIKDVVNEKLNASKGSNETPEPNKLDASSSGSHCMIPSNYLSCTTGETKPQIEAPNVFSAENNLTIDQEPSNGSVITSYITPITTSYIMAISNVSKGHDPIYKPTAPPASVHHLQSFDTNRPLYSRPAPATPMVHSTIAQSPGPLRGYNASYYSSYGTQVPPPLPPPPSLSVEDYFASRYYSNRYSTSAPITCPAEPDRCSFSVVESQGSKVTKGMGYMTSLMRTKSNHVRDGIKRKLSTSVSQMSRTSPLVDLFMEEGRVQRSSMDSGSDQFQDHGFRTVSVDDLVKGAVCCCCWPLGLAARLLTLTISDQEGPIESCAAIMSQQMSTFALLLGIATYFVVFLMWFSLLVVAASK